MKSILILYMFTLAFSNIFGQNESKGRISGEAFVDYFYNVSRDSTNSKLSNTVVNGAKDFNGFEFRRVTFTYDYDFSSKFQSRVRFEANQASAAAGNVTTYIKDLALRWKDIFNGSDLSFGIQPPPSFEVSESYWQFRCLEKTIMDLRSIASSRDMGIALKGKFDNEGILGYWIMFGNNSNIGPEIDKYKRAYAHLNFSPMKNLNITFYGDYKFRPKISQISTANNSVSLNNDVLTSAAFIGIKGEEFSTGIEGYLQITRNGKSALSGNKTVYSNSNGFGISVFGNYEIIDNISLLGRFDYFDPNSNVSYNSRNFMIFGFSYLADKKIRIIPNILLETYEKSKSIAFDPSITARVTVHFVY